MGLQNQVVLLSIVLCKHFRIKQENIKCGHFLIVILRNLAFLSLTFLRPIYFSVLL